MGGIWLFCLQNLPCLVSFRCMFGSRVEVLTKSILYRFIEGQTHWIFSRPTWCKPKQPLQLCFHKMSCPRHFFIGSTRHPTQNAMSTSFVYGVHVSTHPKCNIHVIFMGSKCRPRQWRIPRESGPPGTAITSFAYMELTCPPCVCLWGPWKTMPHVMSHKKRARIIHVLSVSSCFWLVNYNGF